ncbi:MAG: hypothetical protein HC868_11480 [Sphingomonadales bacterium]|nr:hypothetical protein [Sphingomonadales bacterium]
MATHSQEGFSGTSDEFQRHGILEGLCLARMGVGDGVGPLQPKRRAARIAALRWISAGAVLALRERGLSGTIVVSDFHIGGNLRVQFPDARIMQIGYPSGVWPKPSGEGSAWRCGRVAEAPATVREAGSTPTLRKSCVWAPRLHDAKVR